MFELILVPLDGSSLAECVLPHAVALAQAFDAQVALFQAVGRLRETSESRAVDPLGWQMRKAEAGAYLDEVIGRLQDVGLRAEKVLVDGKAAERIVEFAHARDVDLILLSSHGCSGLSEWNISSVVQKVILRAYMPVMIVRAYHPVGHDLAGLRYRQLLVPLDGSQRAEYILPLATALADFHGCRLLLTHVVNKPEMPHRVPLTEKETSLIDQLTEHNQQRGIQYLEQLRSQLSSNIETRLLVSDNVTAALHELVRQEKVDLVLLSAHGYTGAAQWPYGSVALNFIAYGAVPLLIVQDLPKEKVRRTQAERAAREKKGH